METPDRRLNAFRPDLADSALRGKVTAKRFVPGEPAQVAVAAAALRPAPDLARSIDTELLYGETVEVFERRDGWAWTRNRRDGYVGYLREDALTDRLNEPTHRVRALRTYIYPEPDLKTPPLHLVSMNALLTISDTERNGFGLLAEGGWVHIRHIVGIGTHESDPCAVALRFVGTPYLWGGRTSLGLDCSALMQMALTACGIAAPRDSDMQETSVGREVVCDPDLSDLKRGDLVYWKGHCGMWIDPSAFIHANATDMAVTVRPLRLILKHIAQSTGDPVPRVRRPP